MNYTDNNLRGGVKFYSLNDSYLTIFSNDLEVCITTLGSRWSNISSKDIEKILRTGLCTYYFKTHLRKLIACGIDVPSLECLDVLSQHVKIPRFIRDIFREYCRPMYLQDCIYLPSVRYDKNKTTGINIFEEIDSLLINTWNHACDKLKLDIVEVNAESPKSVPLSFYHPGKGEIFAVSPLEEWRIEAFGTIKSLTWQPHSRIDTPDITTQLEIYEDVVNGRNAGPIPCFLYNVIDFCKRFYTVCYSSRFPTDSDFSRTPPKSNNISEKVVRTVKSGT